MTDREEHLIADLSRAGIARREAEAALGIDAILQRWRRRVQKRELGRQALSDLRLDLDLAQLDVLFAVWAPSNEFGDDTESETMVGTVARRLDIDPSRASRITADLIRMGLIRRAVSQRDARRAVLEVTEQGDQIARAVRRYKFLRLGNYLKSWTDEELARFLPLLERFSAWSEDSADPAGQIAAEIATLRSDLAATDLAAAQG